MPRCTAATTLTLIYQVWKACVVVYSGPLTFSLMNMDGREINQVHVISSLRCQRRRAAFNRHSYANLSHSLCSFSLCEPVGFLMPQVFIGCGLWEALNLVKVTELPKKVGSDVKSLEKIRFWRLASCIPICTVNKPAALSCAFLTINRDDGVFLNQKSASSGVDGSRGEDTVGSGSATP